MFCEQDMCVNVISHKVEIDSVFAHRIGNVYKDIAVAVSFNEGWKLDLFTRSAQSTKETPLISFIRAAQASKDIEYQETELLEKYYITRIDTHPSRYAQLLGMYLRDNPTSLRVSKTLRFSIANQSPLVDFLHFTLGRTTCTINTEEVR